MWRVIYGAMLVSMVAAVSAWPSLASAAEMPRMGLLGLLTLMTWLQRPRNDSGRLGEASGWLIAGMWCVAGAAWLSALRSVMPFETVVQSVALTCLVLVVHGSARRRWASVEDALADLAIGYWVIAAACAASVVLAWAGSSVAVNPLTGRVNGVFHNPNMLAAVAALAAPIGIALLRQRVTVVRCASVAATVGAVLLSQSRTALLALAIVGLWLLLRMTPYRAMLPLAYLAALLVVGAEWLRSVLGVTLPRWDASVISRFSNYGAEGALSGRGVIWGYTLDLWRADPLTGTGFATIPSLLPNLLTEVLYGRAIGSAHSGYLQWLAETGVVGALALTIALVAALRASVLSRRGTVSGTVGAAVLAGLVIQVGESALLGLGQPFPYLFWVAASVACFAFDRQGDPLKESSDPQAQPLPRRRSRAG